MTTLIIMIYISGKRCCAGRIKSLRTMCATHRRAAGCPIALPCIMTARTWESARVDTEGGGCRERAVHPALPATRVAIPNHHAIQYGRGVRMFFHDGSIMWDREPNKNVRSRGLGLILSVILNQPLTLPGSKVNVIVSF